MPCKPAPPKFSARASGGDKGLAVKDSLREVRFSVKHRARKLVEAVEAAAQRNSEAAVGPLALLGEPLSMAVRTTATLLKTVDHAAVDLLSSSEPQRTMMVALHSSASYFIGPVAPSDLRPFTTDHHWRYRHWLSLNQMADVFVHEQAIALAASRAAELCAGDSQGGDLTGEGGFGEDESRRRTAVFVIQALMEQSILSKPNQPQEADREELEGLSALGAVAVVLAGEVAGCFAHLGLRDQYASAIRMGHEIAVAERRNWQKLLHSARPVEALERWIAFVQRHA